MNKWSHGLVVMTKDFESFSLGSIPSGTFYNEINNGSLQQILRLKNVGQELAITKITKITKIIFYI